MYFILSLKPKYIYCDLSIIYKIYLNTNMHIVE